MTETTRTVMVVLLLAIVSAVMVEETETRNVTMVMRMLINQMLADQIVLFRIVVMVLLMKVSNVILEHEQILQMLAEKIVLFQFAVTALLILIMERNATLEPKTQTTRVSAQATANLTLAAEPNLDHSLSSLFGTRLHLLCTIPDLCLLLLAQKE